MNIYKIEMKNEDLTELKNFLKPGTSIEIQNQQINVGNKLLDEFADALINWGKNLATKNINKGIVIDLMKTTYNIRTSSEQGSGTILIINRNGVKSKLYHCVKDLHGEIDQTIVDLIKNPSTYPLKFMSTVPAAL